MSDTPASHIDAARSRCPAAAERFFVLLLHAYPPAFRAAFGREMTILFRDQWRLSDAGPVELSLRILLDVVQSAPALRIEAWRAHGLGRTATHGGSMKAVAMLAVLLGVFGTLSALAEGVAGARQGFAGAYLIAVVLAVAAGALLISAAVAALRGTPGGRRTATGAAIASLVLFVVARATFGWMSIFAQLVGIVAPLVILAALHWPRHRGAAPSGAA